MKVTFRRIPLNGDIQDTVIDCAPDSVFNALKYAKEQGTVKVIRFGRIYISGKQVTIRESHAVPLVKNVVITMVEDKRTIGELIML